MPTYDYRCKCGYRRTELHEPEVRMTLFCPRCEERLQWQFPVPQIITDSFSRLGVDDGFGPDNRTRRLAKAKAEAAGVVTTGKKFIPQLCRRGVPLDPGAWVDDRADVRRRCLKEGWGMNERDGGIGSVKSREAEPEPEKPYEVAPDIVDRATKRAAAKHGNLTPREMGQLREQTKQRLRGNQD